MAKEKRKGLMSILNQMEAKNLQKMSSGSSRRIGKSVSDYRKDQAAAKAKAESKPKPKTTAKPKPKATAKPKTTAKPSVKKGTEIYSSNVGSDGRRGPGMPSNPPGMRQTRAGGTSKPTPKRPTRRSRYSGGSKGGPTLGGIAKSFWEAGGARRRAQMKRDKDKK